MPISLDYAINALIASEDKGRSLFWGDDQGYVNVWNICREWHVCDGTLSCHSRPTLIGSSSPFSIQQHSESIMHLRYNNLMGTFIYTFIYIYIYIYIERERKSIFRILYS